VFPCPLPITMFLSYIAGIEDIKGCNLIHISKKCTASVIYNNVNAVKASLHQTCRSCYLRWRLEDLSSTRRIFRPPSSVLSSFVIAFFMSPRVANSATLKQKTHIYFMTVAMIRLHEIQTSVTDHPVAWCVCLQVCHAPAPCKNGSTDQGPVWSEES